MVIFGIRKMYRGKRYSEELHSLLSVVSPERRGDEQCSYFIALRHARAH